MAHKWRLEADAYSIARTGARQSRAPTTKSAAIIDSQWLSNDYEVLPSSEEAWISIAMIRIMLRRLAQNSS